MDILLAEPHEDTASMMDIFLAQQGHEVRHCKNGEDAIRQAKSFMPDVLISELSLPLIDGFEVATHLRREARCNAVMIAHSAYFADNVFNKIAQSGFDFYSLKPTNMNVINLAVLSRRQETLVLLSTELQVQFARAAARSREIVAECALACKRSRELIAACKEQRKFEVIRRPDSQNGQIW